MSKANRRSRWWVLMGLVLLLMPTTLDAQAPQIDPPWTGNLPPGDGIAILQTSRETTAVDLVARLQQEGCSAVSLGSTEDGAWLMYIPGAPPFVNAAFPAPLEAGRGFVVRCGAASAGLTLTEANDGGTAHLQVGGRLRVSLPGNPTTGFNWRVEPDVPGSVLAQVGDAEFTPSSGAIGAGGIVTLEFIATGPGLVQLRLIYDRAWESVPPEDEWQATVIVSGQQTVAWLGEIKSQPAAAPSARYLELRVPDLEDGAVPPGAGIVGADATTSSAIAAFSNTGEEVLVWGELTCGVVDYGDCRIEATTILDAGAPADTVAMQVYGWAGTVGMTGGEDYFQLDGRFPVQYGVHGANPGIQAQLDEARMTGQRIRIWGGLAGGPAVNDVNYARITVTETALAP